MPIASKWLLLRQIMLIVYGMTFHAYSLMGQALVDNENTYYRCYTEEHQAWLGNRIEEFRNRDDFERWMSAMRFKQLLRNERVEILTIPVVIHVIHDGEAVGSGRNLSYEQILSQIDVLNEDFRRLPNTPGYNNESSGADTGIEFCPVTVDPDGRSLSEPGVHRVNRFEAGFSTPPYSNTYVNDVIQPQTIWDPDEYMNIWVCELGKRGVGGILGFAQLPFAPQLEGTNLDRSADTDGVVIHYKAFGRIGDLIPPYTLGRTTTHEVGHWLGLIHTWGDGNCGVDDYCEDTPAASEAVYGCPVNIQGCIERNMVENYMQYTNDVCMNIFTTCQKSRMLTVLSSSPRRASLVNSSKCVFPEEAPEAEFSSSTVEGCKGLKVSFQDQSANRPTSWQWSFPGGNPSSSNASHPQVEYPQPGTYDVSLIVSNAYGQDQVIKNQLINVSTSGRDTFFMQDFEASLVGWDVINPDESITWEISPVSGNASGFKAARVHNFEYRSSGQKDRLITPSIDLRNRQNITLGFRHAYRPFGTNDRDSLLIYVSPDGGNSFPFRLLEIAENGKSNFATYTPTNSDFTPANVWDWCNVDNNFASCIELDLSEFSGLNNVKLAFEVVNDFGNNIYLDDIVLISDCMQVATSDEEKLEKEGYTVYPVPASSELFIEPEGQERGPLQIKIFNVIGELVYIHSNLSSTKIVKIDVSTLPKGNYYLQIANRDKVTYQKLSLFK